MDDELKRLIKEQKAEQRLHSYQPQERHVAFSLDTLVDKDDSVTLLDINVFTEYGTWRPRASRRWDGCPLHGRGELVFEKRGNVRCRACNREDAALRRRLQGVPEKKSCDHDPKHRSKDYRGKSRCKECRRLQRKAQDARFKEKHGMTRNTWKKRLRETEATTIEARDRPPSSGI